MNEQYICPKCGEILNEDDIEMIPTYHNTYSIICQKCTYQGHWTEFIKKYNQ